MYCQWWEFWFIGGQPVGISFSLDVASQTSWVVGVDGHVGDPLLWVVICFFGGVIHWGGQSYMYRFFWDGFHFFGGMFRLFIPPMRRGPFLF